MKRVYANEKWCIGCLTCILVCPYGALMQGEKGAVQKCELCLENSCGSPACVAGCIEGIKSVDKDTKITVISAENHPVYCRPLISYYLENKTILDKMNYRDADFNE